MAITMNGSSSGQKIRIVRLAHMVYKHADIDTFRKFALDFGFEIESETDEAIYFRGYGVQPYVYVALKGSSESKPEFCGGAWAVETEEDLKRAAALPGASAITPLKGPGGGQEVVLRDPDNYPFRIVWGQTLREAEGKGQTQLTNYEGDKPRKNEFVRLKVQPAKVHKLGHYGCYASSFQKTFDWLTGNFNFIATDILTTPEGVGEGGFLRLDRGDELVDHHCYFFQQMPKLSIHHCSFEVHDFDTQLLGHQHLEKQGYKLCWGVGRHILGSQIFDYWFDTTGFMVEHYVDGDILDNKLETQRMVGGPDSLSIWGPPVPHDFLI